MRQFKRRATSLRARQTSAEAKLWYALRNRRLARWKFRRQHCVGPYIVDFITLDGKLVVEVDGATHSTVEETVRDEARTRFLESCGFFVMRVNNLDVYHNLEGVMEAIVATLPDTESPLTRSRCSRPLPGGER